MAKKKIIWSDTAKVQLANVLEYYTQRNGSPDYSIKLLDEIQDLLDTLSQSELIGRPTSDKYTRVISMKVYLIFYEINENNIEIVSFWDNRQDLRSRKIQ